MRSPPERISHILRRNSQGTNFRTCFLSFALGNPSGVSSKRETGSHGHSLSACGFSIWWGVTIRPVSANSEKQMCCSLRGGREAGLGLEMVPMSISSKEIVENCLVENLG